MNDPPVISLGLLVNYHCHVTKAVTVSFCACLQIILTSCALFLWNCTLARRNNLTFRKGQLPGYKGLNIDSNWRQTDISLAKPDPTKDRIFKQSLLSGEGKANCASRSTGIAGADIWQPAIKRLCSLAGIFCLLSCQDAPDMFRHLWLHCVHCDDYIDLTFREHFTSWICRWQIQLNPQPLLIGALALPSHCGSRWCPLGALQKQGDTSGVT